VNSASPNGPVLHAIPALHFIAARTERGFCNGIARVSGLSQKAVCTHSSRAADGRGPVRGRRIHNPRPDRPFHNGWSLAPGGHRFVQRPGRESTGTGAGARKLLLRPRYRGPSFGHGRSGIGGREESTRPLQRVARPPAASKRSVKGFDKTPRPRAIIGGGRRPRTRRTAGWFWATRPEAGHRAQGARAPTRGAAGPLRGAPRPDRRGSVLAVSKDVDPA